MATSPKIATFNEGHLHAALKEWYARSGDRIEVAVDGRQIDIVRGAMLIEIQTRNLAAIRPKLETLLESHPVRLVHPVACEKWISRIDDDGREIGRRRSPRRGRLEDAFSELVSVAGLLAHPNLECEILLTQVEEVRRHEPGRAWRRRDWVVIGRRLLGVLESHLFGGPADFLRTLPSGLPSPFTTADLAEGLGIAARVAQRMAYCLRVSGVISADGKRGNWRTYRLERRPNP